MDRVKQLEKSKVLARSLKKGSRVLCYPTYPHYREGKKRTATITYIQMEKGFFNGCQVEWSDYRKRADGGKTIIKKSGFICGGSVDFLLEEISSIKSPDLAHPRSIQI